MKIQYIKDTDRNKKYNIIVGSIEIDYGILKNDTILPFKIIDDIVCIPLQSREPINAYNEKLPVNSLGNALTENIWNSKSFKESRKNYYGEILVRKSNLPSHENTENFIFTGLTNKLKNDVTKKYQTLEGIIYKNTIMLNNYESHIALDNIPIGEHANSWFTKTFNWGFSQEPLKLHSTLNLDIIELVKEMNTLRSKDELTEEEKNRMNEINKISDHVFGNNGNHNDLLFEKYMKALSKLDFFNDVYPITKRQNDEREHTIKNILSHLMSEEENTPRFKM